MDKAEFNLLSMRYWIRDAFTDKVKEKCNIRARHCRGGSSELFHLLKESPATHQYLDGDKLQIVSGLGHTFIRYKDDEFGRFIYIDPTIAQFVPSFDGIFVGTADELRELVKEPGSRLNIKNYVENASYTGISLPPLTIETNLMRYSTPKKTRKRRGQRKASSFRKRY